MKKNEIYIKAKVHKRAINENNSLLAAQGVTDSYCIYGCKQKHILCYCSTFNYSRKRRTGRIEFYIKLPFHWGFKPNEIFNTREMP